MIPTPIDAGPALARSPADLTGDLSRDARLMEAAEKLEAGFLAEMLTSAGLGSPRGDFGGGAGEEHFSSFLIEAQAREMVAAGGIGLAQSLFEAMKARDMEGH